MAQIDAMIDELDRETRTTRTLFERLPEDRLSWKPHPKSFSLGQLALHIAGIAPGVAALAEPDVAEPPVFAQPQATSRGEALEALEAGLARASLTLAGMDDGRLAATWTLKQGDRILLAMPRSALLRSILLNQIYHHRGQLTVYLRQLDVPLPPVYGPTADEDPLGAPAS